MGIVEQYLLQLNSEKRRLRRAAAILAVLSLLVAICVSWNLRMTGVTIANGATCGQTEHQHTEACPVEKTLICGYPETPEAADMPVAGEPDEAEEAASTVEEDGETPEAQHVHTDACYQVTMQCDVEEHIHVISCYADETADVESAAIWEETIPPLTGQWTDDLLLCVQSQLGIGESETNYIVEDGGQERKGITRFGQWYGNPYGDWSSMFIMFCLNYAEIPQELIPWSPGVHNMMRLAQDAEIFKEPDEQIEKMGNLLFLDTDDDETADKIVVITGFKEENMIAIGGDLDNTVKEIELTPNASSIKGYIDMQELEAAYGPGADGSAFSIGKQNNRYTVEVYALPVDADGKRIEDVEATKLDSFTVSYNSGNVYAEDCFDESLGTYQNAYFGTATSVSVDNISRVWCSRNYNWGWSYDLAYQQTNGTQNTKWISSGNNNVSLYLRYNPIWNVKFVSEGFTTVAETVTHNQYPTKEEPGSWSREGYHLVGWTKNDDEQNVYTYEELMQMPVKGHVTYTAKWVQYVTVTYDLGEYTANVHPIRPTEVNYGGTLSSLPTPAWKNNAIAMAFDGWYLDSAYTKKITADHVFIENTTLFAKWRPKDDGYYVYFMDFARTGQLPLVLMTYSVTKDQTASAYTPSNAPEGTQWDGKWYLDSGCANVYNFSIPVSQMTDYLTGANGRDLYLYPGTQDVCRAIFVTYGSKIDPITVPVGGTINLDRYKPQRSGYVFKGWMLKDGTSVSGQQVLDETTTFYARWDAGYVPFEAILRIENANDTGMTQANVLGTWYAKAGSQIRVKSTYKNSGSNRTGTHEVVCVIDGVEYPVYQNATLIDKATLDDVYAKYFVYNNTGTDWTDEVNWDDVYTGGELPYSTRPISSAGDTIINFDYMRVRNDIVFTISNNSSTGGYIDVYKLQQNGLITGSVIYSGTVPTRIGENVSASGVSAGNIRWSYTATTGNNSNNLYTLHDMKYGQRIYEVYPVGGSWLTARKAAFHQYNTGSNERFSSRRQDLTADFFGGEGRGLYPYSLTAQFEDQEYIALMYAVECLEGETPDFTKDGVGYKVDTELCEVVKHTGGFGIKDLDGCEPGVSANGASGSTNKYYTVNTIPNDQKQYATNMKTAYIGTTSVYTLFAETYWPYYEKFNGVSSVATFAKAYIFYYDRLHMNIQFNFGYDDNGDGANETLKYENIAYGERIGEYQFGMEGYKEHKLLEREGYEFAGWLDANGFVLEAEDWESLVATGDSENNTMIFIAKWEKISNNIVEYYEDRSSTEPFESHYFDDGELLQYPTMPVYPAGWVWKQYGEGNFDRFDWDVPMYGEYGVQEVREINGEEVAVNVIRIYGTWDDSHTKVVYDPNAPQGGVPGTAPTDANEYTIWQSSVPVASRGETENVDPDMIFAGWLLDRDGTVYQPGDHVTVRWPRTMIFTAQWAKPEDVVYLRYDPNGGTPEGIYPDAQGFPYKKNATGLVWNNQTTNDEDWFSRTGYNFVGWNTEPNGSGTAYAPDSNIVLTEPVTTLYAQWKKDVSTLSLYKEDYETSEGLPDATFGLYREENGIFQLVDSFTTGTDGHAVTETIEIDTLYKLVEEDPPNGYAVIAKNIFFKLKAEGKTVSLVFYNAEGNVVSAPKGVTGSYITADKLLTITVKNLRGYALPSTGGWGTTLYILCGLILVLAPLVYGLSLRRKYERRSHE